MMTCSFLIAFLLIISGDRSLGLQKIEEICTRSHSIINVYSNVEMNSFEGVSSDAEECYWVLKPSMTKYIAEIFFSHLRFNAYGKLSLYEYDDENVCTVFGTTCQDKHTIYKNGICISYSGMTRCKVNQSEVDDGFEYRQCNPCFTGMRRVNLTTGKTCYHNCDGLLNNEDSCKKSYKLKVPAVIKLVKGKTLSGLLWSVNFKPCPQDATTFPSNTSSQETPDIADMTSSMAFSITENTPGIHEEPAEPEFPIWKTIIILISTLSMIGFIVLIAFVVLRRKNARKNKPSTTSLQPAQLEDEPGYANVTPGRMTSLKEPGYITEPATVPTRKPIIEKHAYEGIIVEPEVPSNPVYSSVKNQENTYLQPIRREFRDGEDGYQVAIPQRVEDHQYVHFQ